MPGGEQRQFDGQLNDDYSSEALVYRKSQIYGKTIANNKLDPVTAQCAYPSQLVVGHPFQYVFCHGYQFPILIGNLYF